MGNHWTLQEADKNFSAVREAAREGGPQHVGDDSSQSVVVLSAAEFARLSRQDLPRSATTPETDFVAHLLNAPRLPEGMEEIFDDRHQYPSTYRDANLEN